MLPRCPLRSIGHVGALALTAVLIACAAPEPYDYTAFKQNRPVSMLVLPPVNESPEVTATYGVLSQLTLPLAEAGYYVIPVSLMDETFRQNGLNNAAEIHDVSPQKLREI
ncbi:MAG: GNA1162 family protein, partial [Burkholderiales bacterium]